MQINDNIKFSFDGALSTGGKSCQNILIKGDNKLVLPELAKIYGNKIKCIYIDPPYNNGESYHYYNDKAPSNSWLKDMRIVIMWLRLLLTKDGSLWISIDDNEMAYLKVEADKIFGRENFAGTIVWQHRKTRENRAVFSHNHEYILVYAKDIKAFKKSRNLLPVDDDFVSSKYKNPDNDVRGPWQSITASVQAGHAVPNQFYTIVSPSGIKFDPPKGRCWVYNEEKMKGEIADNRIWFGSEGNHTPRIKKFLSEAKIGLTPETLWIGENFGTTDSAKKHLLSLFPKMKNVFDTPKPEELIKRILEIASNEDDYVLDCFLGSGTTITTAHKMHRKYIGIEQGEQMTELVVRRLNGVIDGEQGGISQSVNWKGGGEFAFYNFDKNKEVVSANVEVKEVKTRKTHYRQLNLFEALEKYPDVVVDNSFANEDLPITNNDFRKGMIDVNKHVLICLAKDDNAEQFVNESASVYYTGKKFPSTIDLECLYYFMPYIKNKGIRDLYLIKRARIGSRKEGLPDNNPKDLRLVFEIEFISRYFNDYKPINLDIWHTFKDTELKKLPMSIKNRLVI